MFLKLQIVCSILLCILFFTVFCENTFVPVFLLCVRIFCVYVVVDLGALFLAREQVLVLDEADRILDVGFKKELNAIISQLPKHRQTLLFSATQTKSVQDLARLSLKDPEYLGVHEESDTATPNRLQQTAMLVPLDKKLDMLWSFIKAHLNSRILVFLSSCKQVYGLSSWDILKLRIFNEHNEFGI